MALKVRRVVIGYNADGKAVVKTDEQLGAVSRGGVAGVFGCEMWSTDQMPIDNSSAADAAQRAGFVPQNRNYVGTGGGALLRIDEFAPGAARFTHRTETLDHITMLSGEIDLELDSGEVVHLKSGDVLLNRGMLHTWVNNGSVPAVMVATMIDAKPPEVNGKILGAVFPSFPGQRKGDKQ
jgi:quercetin dioxygenase-like cupin family protein